MGMSPFTISMVCINCMVLAVKLMKKMARSEKCLFGCAGEKACTGAYAYASPKARFISSTRSSFSHVNSSTSMTFVS